jgi:glycosyltransferase involved in cell wall biosynthesis
MLYGGELAEILDSGHLIHCSEEPYVFCGGQVAWLTGSKKPFVFQTAQNIKKSYPPPFGWIEKFCVERCAGWIACGESIVETRPQYYLEKPHRVMPLGVDVDLFSPNPARRTQTLAKLCWRDDCVTVGFVGRFVEEKGIGIILDCLKKLRQPWRGLFLGGGQLEPELKRFEAMYPDRVRVVVGLPHDEVPAYLNAIDILLAPSQTRSNWREQFGRMIIEAFACGVPVIASNSGEIPNVVGDAGIIVDENAPQDWLQNIQRLLSDASLRCQLKAAGLDRVHQKYTWPLIAHQHCDFFDELEASRP